MGKMWETKEDLAREKDVADYACDRWGVTAFKLPIQYHADYALVRHGKIAALMEIRCRNKKYETFMFSVQKRMHVRHIAQDLGVKAFFVIKFPDGIYYLDFDEEPDHSGIGGRNELRDDRDVEIVYHYNVNRLKKL